MDKYTILDTPKIIQVAREHAILGYYSEAIQKYKMALNLVQKRKKEIKNEFLVSKWVATENNIMTEISQTEQILKICASLKDADIDYSKKELGSDKKNTENKNSDKLFIIPFKDENSKKLPNVNHFEGKLPFEQNRFNDDPFHDFSKQEINSFETNEYKINKFNDNKEPRLNYMNQQEDYVVYRKPIKNIDQGAEKKDPMVWDPPEDKIRIVKNPSSKKNPPISNKKSSGNKANIAKLYDEVEKYKGNNKKKYGNLLEKEGKNNPQKDQPKSAFLLHHYPDGVGPDTDLIEMLEREVVDTNPHVSFDDIADLEDAKNILKECVLFPILFPNFFKGIRRPWRGVLLYGPPGTGKTMLAKALATQGKTTFFNVHSSSFASKWRGESEKLIRILFEMARFYAPTTIFIDEVDSIGSKRGEMNECESSRRVKAELLVQMDGVTSSSSAGANEETEEEKRKIVMVLGATNRPWDLDEALRRRFEKRVYIPLPVEKGREELFKLNLKTIPLADDVDFKKLIRDTAGYSGCDIANICREAAYMPMRKKLLNGGVDDILSLINKPELKEELEIPLCQEDFDQALMNISKSVSENDLKDFEVWAKDFKSI